MQQVPVLIRVLMIVCVFEFVCAFLPLFYVQAGKTEGVTLASANNPAAVLHQRLTFYCRVLSKPPAAKAHMLTALLSHR
jgi:hypothetical protein